MLRSAAERYIGALILGCKTPKKVNLIHEIVK